MLVLWKRVPGCPNVASWPGRQMCGSGTCGAVRASRCRQLKILPNCLQHAMPPACARKPQPVSHHGTGPPAPSVEQNGTEWQPRAASNRGHALNLRHQLPRYRKSSYLTRNAAPPHLFFRRGDAPPRRPGEVQSCPRHARTRAMLPAVAATVTTKDPPVPSTGLPPT